MSFAVFSKPKNLRLIGLGTVAIALTVTASFWTISHFSLKSSIPVDQSAATIKKIAALGRLEPEAEIIRLSAPKDLDGDRVAQLLIKQGDRVQKNQVIAVLDSHDRLRIALQQAQEQVRIAEAKLAQIKAGAKRGELRAQQATIDRLQADRQGELATQQAEIARWEAEVRTAQSDFNRFAQLYGQGAIAASNLDAKRLALNTAQAQLIQARTKQTQFSQAVQAQLNEATANLNRIAEVRPVDVQVAQREIDGAIAAVKRAETELNQAYVRAPIDGQILKIHTRIGEKINDSGIADLAQTDRMVAIAEVYQSDIANVKVGQTATITSQAFQGELRGTVMQIGLQVNQQNVFSNQPGENLDRRVIDVKIRLTPEASKQVSGLTNLQVQTAISLD